MSALNPLNWLVQKFLWRIVERQPDDSRRGFRQRYLTVENFAPFENVWTREVLVQRSKAQNPLAGFYSPKGEALPATDIGYDQMLMALQDVKATRYLDPDLYREMVEIGELAVFNAGNTQMAKAKSATALKKLTEFMRFCNDQVDTSMEYLLVKALEGQIVWPPVDDGGDAIASPPDYWNGTQYSGTWPYPLEADKIQDITGLVDKDGSFASTDIRTVWTDASADILGALRTINELMIEKYAVDLDGGTILMPTTTKNLLKVNTGVVEWLAGANKEQPGARRFMSDNELETVLQQFGDMTIRKYDSFWTYDSTPGISSADTTVTKVKFLTPGKIILMPRGGVGAKMGTVPLQTAAGRNAPWKPGKFTWFYENPKPNFEKQVGVNVVAWPLFESGHYPWFVLDVLS